MQFSFFYMFQAKTFLKFIFTPKEIYAILDKFGYKPGNLLIKAVIKKKYAEEREHKIVLTKLGKARLKELEDSENNTFVEVQPEPVQQLPEPEKKTATFLIFGIVSLFGFIFSILQVSSSKIFMPYGIIGILFLAAFILAIILFFKR